MTKLKRYVSIFAFFVTVAYGIYYVVPNRVILQEGEDFDVPPLLNAVSSPEGAHLRLFGIMPIKKVHIDVIEKTQLIPCGNTVGIRINIGGVMVVSLSSVRGIDGKKHSPAQSAGIKQGDVITKINEREITTIAQLAEQIEGCNAAGLTFQIKREEEVMSFIINPVLSKDDNTFRIGAWVRESSSGIGTVTYINPNDNTFAALGHGITDADTQKLIPAREGDILYSKIIDIKKGRRGSPGELRGVFSPSAKIGLVKKNTDKGIFGIVNGMKQPDTQPFPVASRSQVKLGEAYILSNIEDDVVKKYSINIESIMKNTLSNKSIIIKITDDELIRKTGGIVQGMSGCPIIQNGYLVGAVTHVFINDPTKGYATFIDVMINNNK